MNQDDTLARNRFVVLNLVRLGGLALVLFGIAIHYGRIEAPQFMAYVLVVAGLAEFFWGPNLVSRGWRTRDE